VHDGSLDQLARDQQLDRPCRDEPVVQPTLGTDVGPLQVDGREPGVVPRQVVAPPHAFEEPQLREPLDLARTARRVVREPPQDGSPAVEDVAGLVVADAAGVLEGHPDRVEVLPLDLERREPATVDELEPLGERDVATHDMHRVDRVAQRKPVDRREGAPRAALGHRPLDEPQDEGRRAELEVRRDLEEVRVPDDHVQTPPALGVRVRLVARVDDRSTQRRLEPDLGLDVVRALRQLEARHLAALAEAHPTRAGEHLARDEERRQARGKVGERHRAVDEVVLVRAVRRALAVHVVLVQRDVGHREGRRECAHGREHDELTGPVPAHAGERPGDLGRGVLGVGVVDVQACAVRQDDVRGPGVVVLLDAGAREQLGAVAGRRGLRRRVGQHRGVR
jgi:hypothetical protein